ncbi:hypothetical protein [Leifsonia sp. Leaf264]|uniref:hypothetical protein n=1 Tax=Leifsonia sp. Leaf264 TaxID=1736314 RepID=UPI0012FA347B|nr:hypothetical protein [Leifsonia sp. Leaf264]
MSEAAWDLTRRLSCRPTVRVAAPGPDGSATNRYTDTASIRGEAPDTPWALYLTDMNKAFRYVVFDLDASKGNPERDSKRLTAWLTAFSIGYTVCLSSPAGGRHVWVATAEPIAANLVAAIGVLASQLLHSVDTAPLSNRLTGCVRPPGAPHRNGGHSIPVTSLEPLLSPSTVTAQLEAFRDHLIDLGAALPESTTSTPRGVTVDDHGHPHLIGDRRPVTTKVRKLIDEPSDEQDLSRVMAVVLSGCARARWRYADVHELLAHSPALEHARTSRGANMRLDRSVRQQEKALQNAWRYAVQFVATNLPAGDSFDATFDARAAAVSDAVEAAQRAADASPGLWSTNRSRRQILDAVSAYILQSVSSEVEADTRRLSQDTGYGREACRLALLWLTQNNWLVLTTPAAGVHGATFRLGDRFSTDPSSTEWAQAVTRPAVPPDERRKIQLRKIVNRLELSNHDAFASPGSLGRDAGTIFAALGSESSATTLDLLAHISLTIKRLRAALTRLSEQGLVVTTDTGWQRTNGTARERVAVEFGVAGYLEGRRHRYDIERQVWAWWQAEYEWMKSEHRKPGRRPPPTSVLLVSVGRPPSNEYPRGPNNRADHREAKRVVLGKAANTGPLQLRQAS